MARPARRPWILAHRGWHKEHPENSLGAIAAAQELGCHGAEFDVQELRDRTFVIHHDSVLRADGGRRRLSGLDWEGFRSLAPPGAALRLDQLLEWAKGHETFLLNVELKESVDVRRVLPLLDLVKPSRMVVTSFEQGIVADLRRLRPAWDVGWITESESPDVVRTAVSLTSQVLVVESRTLTAPKARDAASNGIRLWAWGVDDVTGMRQLSDWGVEAIISDAPDRLLGGLGAFR